MSPMLIYADRKVWAAVQMRRGPNVVGPWGLLQTFADMFKFVIKETIIPAGANKGRLHSGAAVISVTLASPPGPSSRSPRLGGRQHQGRHSLHFRDLVARRLRHHHGRLGVEFEVSVPVGLRSAAQMVSYEVSIGFVIVTVLLCAGSLNLTDIVDEQDTDSASSAGMAAAPADVRGLLRLGSGGNQPPAVRPAEAESQLVAGFKVEYSSRPTCSSSSANTSPSSSCAALTRFCSSAAGCRRSRSRPSPGCPASSGSR